jgi:hypothetical protein
MTTDCEVNDVAVSGSMSPNLQTSGATLSSVVLFVDDDDSVETVSTFISCFEMLYLSHSSYVTCFKLCNFL